VALSDVAFQAAGLDYRQPAITAGPVIRKESKEKRNYGKRKKEEWRSNRLFTGDLSKTKVKETTFDNTKLNTVKLDWKEVYYTNCPLVSASNVDQELGWTREEYKKIA